MLQISCSHRIDVGRLPYTTMPEDIQTVRILGIDFYNGSLSQALDFVHNEGGLILAPSGPGLSDLGRNPNYDAALRNADINLLDSGYLALLWKKRTGENLQRHSGLKFIKSLIEDERFEGETGQLWVMPTRTHIKATRVYLAEKSIHLESHAFYEAPFYEETPIMDPELLRTIQEHQPRYVILCIAGGKQEVLGHWLRGQLDYSPAIICIGAAIAFLTGQQANIPPWADRIYLGWLLRILQNPRTFFPRYWKARKLGRLVNNYGAQAPHHPNEHK